MKNDTYKEVKVFHYPNMVVRVHIPDITPEERARRMERIAQSAAALLAEGRIANGNETRKEILR